MTGPVQTWRGWLEEHEFEGFILCDAAIPVATLAQSWQPTKSDEEAAWPFLVELRSRIATRPLEPRSGDEQAALTSVYQLFPIFRRLAQRHLGCFHFTTLTLDLLDRYVRPFTARWHRHSLTG